MNAIASIIRSLSARMLSARALGPGAAAILVLLGPAHPAAAATSQRGARDISGFWVQYPFGLTFDPTLGRGDAQKVALQPAYDTPYKARLAAVAKGEAEGKPLANASSLCLPVGMPGDMMGFAPMEIVPIKKTIFVFPEGWDPPRRIYMDGRPMPALDELEPTFAGFSVGRWEGDTLVVDTAGIKASAQLEEVPHSNELRVNERIRLLDEHTLQIVFTLTDPRAFKAPWVITRQYKDYATLLPGHLPGEPVPAAARNAGKPARVQGARLEPAEVVCNENNRNPTDATGVVGLKLGSE